MEAEHLLKWASPPEFKIRLIHVFFLMKFIFQNKFHCPKLPANTVDWLNWHTQPQMEWL